MHKLPSTRVWLWSSLDSAIAIAAAFSCFHLVYSGPDVATLSAFLAGRLSIENFLLLTMFVAFWTGVHQLVGLYRKPMLMSWRSLLRRAASASALGAIFFMLFPLLSHNHQAPLHKPVLIFFAVACASSLVLRLTLWSVSSRILNSHQRVLRTLIIGSGPIAHRLLESLDARSKQSVVGFVDSPGVHTVLDTSSLKFLGPFNLLEQVLMGTAIDEVLIALPLRSCYDQVQRSIQICERIGVPVSYHFHPFSHTLGFAQVQQRALHHYISWRPSRVEQSSLAKRSIDFASASATLFLLSPLFLVIAIALKVSSRGPVFFAQERYGLNKQRFRIYKFRTMVPDAEALQVQLESANEAQGPVFKIKNDPRVTSVGKFLRRTSLDELPQLINVLKGEMSLVGPRPLNLRDVSKFSDPWLMRRFSVKPGLTCLWQVRGRSSTSFDQWIAYDLEYIDTWSPLLDWKILLMTIPAVLTGRGAL